jgi:superkiller protein 3
LRTALDGTYGDEGGEVAGRLANLSEAVANWDRSIRETEQNVRTRLEGASPDVAAGAHETLGSLYLERGRFADAAREFEAASKLAPRQLSPRLSRAVALEAIARPAVVADAFREAWTLEPDNPITTYLAIAHEAIGDKDLIQARETLWRSVQGAIRGGRSQTSPFPLSPLPIAEPGGDVVFPLARYSDGFSLAARGLFDEAIASLRKAAGNDPLTVDPAVQTEGMRQGANALRLGGLRAALAAFQKAVEASPNSSEAHRMLATAAGLAGDARTSTQHFQAALKIRPDDERSWIALANHQVEAGAIDEAARTLQKATAAIPDAGGLRWRLAGLLVRLDQVDGALAQYAEAERLSPLSGGAALHQNVARAATLQQDVAAAAVAGERRVRASPNDAAAHRDLASLDLKQGRQDEAFAELTIAAWLDPNDPLTFNALGQSLMAEGRNEDAVAAFERAVQLQPDLREARYGLAQALTAASRREDAQRHLAEFDRQRGEARAREQRAIDVDALKEEAARKSAAGQHAQAVMLWKKVLGMEPNRAQNYLALAEALVKAGALEDSLQFFVKTADLDGVAEVHLRLAEVLARLGRVRESALARETYEKLRLDDFRRRSNR